MGDTDTQVLDTSIPGSDVMAPSTGIRTEHSRYQRPHPLNVNINIT